MMKQSLRRNPIYNTLYKDFNIKADKIEKYQSNKVITYTEIDKNCDLRQLNLDIDVAVKIEFDRKNTNNIYHLYAIGINKPSGLTQKIGYVIVKTFNKDNVLFHKKMYGCMNKQKDKYKSVIDLVIKEVTT